MRTNNNISCLLSCLSCFSLLRKLKKNIVRYQTVFHYVTSAPSDWLRRELRQQRGGNSAALSTGFFRLGL